MELRLRFALSEFIRNKAKENPKRYNRITTIVLGICMNSSYEKHIKVDIKERSKWLGISPTTYYKALNILLEDKIISKGIKRGYYIFNEDTINDAITAYNLAHYPTQEEQIREGIINKMFKLGCTTDQMNLINDIL